MHSENISKQALRCATRQHSAAVVSAAGSQFQQLGSTLISSQHRMYVSLGLPLAAHTPTEELISFDPPSSSSSQIPPTNNPSHPVHSLPITILASGFTFL